MAEDPILEHVAALLARTPSFRALEAHRLREVAAACAWFCVPGGTVLLRQGEPSDAIYVVVNGLLGAYRRGPQRHDVLLNRIGPGTTVGEIGFITGEPRSATVKALRACELLRIDAADFEHIERLPGVLRRLCGTIVKFLESTENRRALDARPRTFCIVPHDASVDADSFARQFASSLGDARSAVVRKDPERQTAEWFSHLESLHEAVIYSAEPEATPWTRLCLRQADRILLLARGAAEPTPFTALGPGHRDLPEGIRVETVLLWDAIESGRTARWLALAGSERHHHVRSETDAARAARLVAGRGRGLVLSGGGARGLAHIGVIRALQERRVIFDAVGGTSIGAVIGAAFASELDYAAMREGFLDAFLRRRPLVDFALSKSALLSGRRLRRIYEDWFGNTGIEEMPIRYFCVTTDLVRGAPSVHERGPLVKWLQASTAIPGVFPPVLDKGAVHVDGGVVNNLPVDVMRGMDVQAIVAVDVAPDAPTGCEGPDSLGTEPRPPNMLELLWRVGTVSSCAGSMQAHALADLVLQPAVSDVGLLSWRAFERAVEAGYDAAAKRMRDIEALAG